MNPSPSPDAAPDPLAPDEPPPDPAWEPPRNEEAAQYRARLTEELRPLVESIRRLRDRGLLE